MQVYVFIHTYTHPLTLRTCIYVYNVLFLHIIFIHVYMYALYTCIILYFTAIRLYNFHTHGFVMHDTYIYTVCVCVFINSLIMCFLFEGMYECYGDSFFLSCDVAFQCNCFVFQLLLQIKIITYLSPYTTLYIHMYYIYMF